MTTTLDAPALIGAGAIFAVKDFTDPRIVELIEARIRSGAEQGSLRVRLAQFVDENGKRALVVTARGESRLVKGARTTLELARQAIAERRAVAQADRRPGRRQARRSRPRAEGAAGAAADRSQGSGACDRHRHRASRISARPRGATRCTRTSPIPPSSPTRCGCSSSASRAASRARARPASSPNGSTRATARRSSRPEAISSSPAFALDGGEEPEIVGIYLIDDAGAPVRIGFALGNEFSDHVTERQNYLWLAHSKLRPASFGPELLIGDLPPDVQGVSRIRRGKDVIWEKPFLSGEQNMAHTIANLEAHHFKYALFRRPGDVHVHFFGTATLSFSEGVKTEKGDVFEIESEPFGLPLRNRLGAGKAAKAQGPGALGARRPTFLRAEGRSALARLGLAYFADDGRARALPPAAAPGPRRLGARPAPAPPLRRWLRGMASEQARRLPMWAAGASDSTVIGRRCDRRRVRPPASAIGAVSPRR